MTTPASQINPDTDFLIEDYTFDYPDLSIREMIIVPGAREFIIASDVGVFYTTESLMQGYPDNEVWFQYGTKFPYSDIERIELGIAYNKIRIGTFGRGVWENDLPCSKIETELIINSNTTWSGTKRYRQDIRVEAGNTLTITGKVYMAEGTGILIEPNAQLIVDGGTITNACGGIWRGIEVWGNTFENQYPDGNGNYHQGRAIFKNNAVIENAWEGVQNWRPQDWDSRGGIIQATETQFINCRIAARFMKYQNTMNLNPNFKARDASYFRLCNFFIDDQILDDPNQMPPRPRVTLWGTDRVRFEGCNFENIQNVDASEKRVQAIYSHDANYIVREHCSTALVGQPCQEQYLTPSNFSGWHTAIKALETTSGRPILVRGSEFEKNMIGVEIDGTDYSQIYRNKFEVGGHPFPDWAEEPYYNSLNHLGIYSNSTLHFTIEQNEVKKQAGAMHEGHGVLVYNSRGAENQIYNNEFENLRTGVDALQINRNTTFEGGVSGGAAGLQFLCNQNSGNEVDFEISRSGLPNEFEFEEAGVRREHGSDSPDFPAENTFSAPNSNPARYTHFDVNSDQTYRYFFHNNSPNPAEITPGAFANPIMQVDPTNNCPLNFTTPGGIKYEVLVERRDDFEGLRYTYDQIIDQGNTQGTITEIELTWPEQAWALRDELMLRSPYNSEEVLMAAIQKNIMPHAMLL